MNSIKSAPGPAARIPRAPALGQASRHKKIDKVIWLGVARFFHAARCTGTMSGFTRQSRIENERHICSGHDKLATRRQNYFVYKMQKCRLQVRA